MEKSYEKRLNCLYDELKWLYMELYPGRTECFASLCEQMHSAYLDRDGELKESDLSYDFIEQIEFDYLEIQVIEED